MFSYFKDGIKDTTPTKKISIEALVKEIKNNNNLIIQEIRNFDSHDIDYEIKKKKLKQGLSNITPNCTVSYRDDDHITEFTGYMYFDIDHVDDPIVLKSKLIEEYKEYIGMICISCSGKGLSILTKIENEITKSNFNSIREYICANIFHDLNLDPKTKSKSNAWFISYDPNCYFNPCSVITIPEEFIVNEHIKKGDIHTIYNPPTDLVQKSPYQYKLIPISEVIDKLKFKTDVIVENKVFDLRPAKYCEVYLPVAYKMPKGKKQSIFSQIIHNLVYLNPEIEPDYIFSYINWLNINKTVAGTRSTMQDLIRHFNMVYTGIIKTGILKPTIRTKYFHCKANTISGKQRKELSRRMTDMYKVYNSISRISLAKKVIELKYKEGSFGNIINPSTDSLSNDPSSSNITQRAVLNLINGMAKEKEVKGICLSTVKKYWNLELIDIDEVVRMENESIEITYIPKESKGNEGIDNGVLDTQILDGTENEYSR